MLYRENGQFKTSYRADQQIFPIAQDRWAILALVAFAFVGVPFLVDEYLYRAILIPFLILSLAALGVNILVGYCGQISLGSGAFMAVGAYAAYNIFVRIDGMPVILALQIEPGRLHQQLEAWAAQFGPVYQIRFGRFRTLVVSDHQAVAATLRDRPEGFRRTARLQQIGLEMGLKPGVFGATGDEWKRQRRMVMHGFDPTHVRRYFPALQGVAQRLAGRWQRAAQGVTHYYRLG